jgi:hypothetical protein
MVKTPTCSFAPFKKEELDDLAVRLLDNDLVAIEWCVTFLEAETFGVGHGRARARMARRLKHCSLSIRQKSRLVKVIVDRLVEGRFSEQFKDQLRLAMQIDPQATFDAARKCRDATVAHVRRYAQWVLERAPGSPVAAEQRRCL